MTNRGNPLRRSFAARRVLFAGFLVLGAACAASATEPVVRVEEQFELAVVSADANSASPQIVCTMSPSDGLDGQCFTFEINHQSLPEFVAGGLHVQAFQGPWPIDSRKFPSPDVMSTSGEVVRWTQVLTLDDGQLTFEIVGGTSETWGTFGGQGYLKLSVATTLEDLNGYQTSVSVENSGVSYGGNRVQSLSIRGVRWTLANGQVVEDSSVHTIHELP